MTDPAERAAQGADGEIAIYLPDLGGGGAERTYVLVANALAARGKRVGFVLGRGEGPFLGALDERVGLRVLGASGRVGAVRALARHLRQSPPEVLLAGVDAATPVALAARALARSHVPVVSSTHVNVSAFFAGMPRAKAAALTQVLRRALPLADARVAVSEGVARDLEAFLGLPRAGTTVIHNPVNLPEIARLSAAPAGHPWLEGGAHSVLIGMGRFVPQKDFVTLLRALALLEGRDPPRLILLGDGPGRAELKRERDRLGLGARVDMPGYTENPFAVMARAEAFVLSSRFEGFGNVLVEAMACGCPVVSTDCPSGPSEILEAGRHGPLVPVGDAAALAGAIAETLAAPPSATHLRARAADFAVETVADRYFDLFQRVIREKTEAK